MLPSSGDPSVKLVANHTRIGSGDEVEIRAQATDPDHTDLIYAWDFGDGTFDGGEKADGDAPV